MSKKYELTDETMEWEGHTLHRIKALRDFNDVKAGDLGGWVESEDNLSQYEKCWLCDNAKVYGNAIVCDNAKVYGNAIVCDNARVYDNAMIRDNARVCNNAIVYSNATVCTNARVCNNAIVYGNAIACGNAIVCDDARVCDNAIVCDDARIYDTKDYCIIIGFGSRLSATTFFRCKDDEIRVNCGCFNGTLDEFRDKVKETHKDNKYAKEYLLAIDMVKVHFS